MPTEQDEEIKDLDSSTSSTDDTTVEKAVEPADSSAATGESDDDGLLSVARDAIREVKQNQTASPAEGEEDGTSSSEEAPKEPDDEDFSDVPFNKHPRFKQLIGQLREAKVDAQRYRNVEGFLQRTGLSPEDAAGGLEIMALIKVDPQEAWKRLQPIVKNVLIAAGEVLPDDLQKQVTEGVMSKEAAIEVSRARAAVAAVKTRTDFEAQRQQKEAERTAVNSLVTAASDWEAERRRKDPNFDAKFVALQKEILFLQSTDGKPNTPEGVKAQLNKAYKALNLAPPAAAPAAQKPPARPAIRPITGGQVAGGQKPEPKSTLDIVRAHRQTA